MSGHSVIINEDLFLEIKEYCRINGLKVSELCNEILKDGIKKIKYGDIPFGIISDETATVQSMNGTEGISLIKQLSKFEDGKEENRQEFRLNVPIQEEKNESRQESRHDVAINTNHKRTRILK